MSETPAGAFGPAVTVDATDLHALVCAFAQVEQSFRPFLSHLPAVGNGREACLRLASVLTSAASPLPPDPVSDADAAAIGTSEMTAAYERHGFTRDEAFQLTLAWIQATAGAAMRQAMGGGA